MINLIVALAEQLIDQFGFDTAVGMLTAISGTSASLVRALLAAVGLS
jgi:hypothetical protein